MHQGESMQAEAGSQRGDIPIGRSLLLSSLAVAGLSLAVAFAGVQALVYEPARRAVAKAELGRTARQVESSLAGLLKRVDTISRLKRDWGALGLLSTGDEQGIVRLIGTELTHEPSFSSVAIGDETGREVLIRRSPDGGFVTRQTDPDVRRGTEIDTAWTVDARRLESSERASDYDTRVRPWFRQVADAPPDARVVWTAPFIFKSNGLPGMSAVVQWVSPDGRRNISTTDIPLTDVSRLTRELEVGRHGFALVVTGDGALIGVPGGDAAPDDEHARALLLRPLAALGRPALDAAFARWKAAPPAAGADTVLRFSADGQPWLASFARLPLEGPTPLVIGVAAPESDFAIAGPRQWMTLVAVLLVTISLSAWAAVRGARRFARPLKALAAAADRIGRLDLAGPVRVPTRWREVAETAQAQEVMRQRLLQATEGLEAAVERRTAQLTVAVAAADEAARAKSAFLANMSHEIRTPLNAILGLGTLLQKSTLDDTQRDYLKRLDDASRLLLNIVNDVLDFSKMEAGKLALEQTEFALDDLLQRVANLLIPMTQSKPLEVVMRRAPDVPNLLVGDATRLEQVLINLAGNAVKFTATGEVLLEAALESAQPEGVRLRFTIRDSGIGMSPQQIEQLFKPFRQGDDSMARRFGGTGLGLAISKHLVELMGGRIAVESTLMVGSTFRVVIPLRTLAALDARADAKPWHPLRGLRALVVDDNPTSLGALCEILDSFDVACVARADADAAVDEFARAEGAGAGYRFVLVDWTLPGATGLEVIERMRERAPSASTEFIMVAADRLPEVEQRVRAARIGGLISKPTTPSSLLEAILAGLHRPLARMAAATEGGAAAPPLPGQGRHVLLVEDNEVNLLIAREFLKAAGVEVTPATSAREAIALVRGGAQFDLVFMDVQMADMDGLEATRVMRAMPGGANLVIVALTAHALPGDRARCLAAGMDDYLSKPLSPQALDKCLRRWLSLA
jgi:signal transduction histidine kinase/DNA-binding response OmpR family regulator